MIEFNPDEIENLESNFEYQEKSIQLIKINGVKYELNASALDLIRSIEDEIIVVTAIGKEKTGKSYLLNLLLDNIGRKDGFEINNNSENSTKGIWMWGAPKERKSGKGKILFIDSGPTSRDGNSNNYNHKIFALLVLISSLLINNTNSNLDDAGLNEMRMATQLPNSIITQSKVDKEAFITESCPKLLWILRDFNQPKVDPFTQKEISSKEFLDICLRNKFDTRSQDIYNIKESLLKYFPDRDCVTLVKPLVKESDLKMLNNIMLEKLNPDFQNEILELKNKIFKNLSCKRIKGKKLNGFSLAFLIEEWIKTVNAGETININSVFDNLIFKDIEDFYKKALVYYENHYLSILDNNNQGINENGKNIGQITSGVYEQEELLKKLFNIKLESMTIFNKIFNFNQDTFNNSQYMVKYNEYKRNLETEFSKYEGIALEKNKGKCTERCNELLKISYEGIYEKSKDNKYSSTNCEEYLKDHENFLNIYLKYSKGIFKTKNLVDFLSENKPEFLNKFVEGLGNENKIKLQEMINSFNESERKKNDAEIRNNKLNEITQSNNDKIGELNSELEKKKREIIDLSERIKLLDNEIKEKRENTNLREVNIINDI